MTPIFVIPANAGIQLLSLSYNHWIPAFAGMTTRRVERARVTSTELANPAAGTTAAARAQG